MNRRRKKVGEEKRGGEVETRSHTTQPSQRVRRKEKYIEYRKVNTQKQKVFGMV